MSDRYEVETVSRTGETRRFPCDGRTVDRVARRESQRWAIREASVSFAGVWIVTYENGRRARGASDS